MWHPCLDVMCSVNTWHPQRALFLPLCWRSIQTMQSMSRAMLCKRLLQFRKEPQWTGYRGVQNLLFKQRQIILVFTNTVSTVRLKGNDTLSRVERKQLIAVLRASSQWWLPYYVLLLLLIMTHRNVFYYSPNTQNVKLHLYLHNLAPKHDGNPHEIFISEQQTPDSFWTIPPPPPCETCPPESGSGSVFWVFLGYSSYCSHWMRKV